MSQGTCLSNRRRMLIAVRITSASAAFSQTPFVCRSPRVSSSAIAAASSFACTRYIFISGSDLVADALERFAGGGEDEELDEDPESDCVGLGAGRLKGMLEIRRIGVSRTGERDCRVAWATVERSSRVAERVCIVDVVKP